MDPRRTACRRRVASANFRQPQNNIPAAETAPEISISADPAGSLDAGVLFVVVALERNRGAGTQQGHAAVGDDAFFNRGAGGVQRIFDAATVASRTVGARAFSP